MNKVFFTEEVAKSKVNPFEAVLLASKEARRLNKARLNAGIPEGEEKVTTVALERLVTRKIRGSYNPKDAEGGADDAASRETDSAGR